jgi:hypothetical protein
VATGVASGCGSAFGVKAIGGAGAGEASTRGGTTGTILKDKALSSRRLSRLTCVSLSSLPLISIQWPTSDSFMPDLWVLSRSNARSSIAALQTSRDGHHAALVRR